MSVSKNLKFKVQLGVWGTDAGDGSYSTEYFPSQKDADEAREEYAKENNYDLDDAYQTGNTDEVSFEFELVDGKLVLINKPYVNMGQ